MLTQSAKTDYTRILIAFSVALTCSLGFVSAQDAAPTEQVTLPAKTENAAEAGGTAESSGKGEKDSSASAMDYLYNRKPAQGTAAREAMDAQAAAKAQVLVR